MEMGQAMPREEAGVTSKRAGHDVVPRTCSAQTGEGTFHVSFVPLAEIAAIRADHTALFARLPGKNLFLGPDYLAALVPLLPAGAQVALVREAAGGALRGLMPFIAGPALPGMARRINALRHALIADTTPLIENEAAAGALLDALGQRFGKGTLALDAMRTESPAGQMLLHAIAARALPSASLARWERACIRAGGIEAAAYLAQRVKGKRLRELRREERRLADLGEVTFESLTDAEGVKRGVALFLALEAASWKGARGTALGLRADMRAFAQAAFRADARPAARVDVLSAGDQPVSVAIHLVDGDSACAFKCSYDARAAKGSPGLVTDVRTLDWVTRAPDLACMDSLAIPGHPVEALWRERIVVADLRIGFGRATNARLEREASLERRYRAMRARAIALVLKAKGWHTTRTRAG